MRVGITKAGPAEEGVATPAAAGVLPWSMRAWAPARCRAQELHVEERIEAALDSLAHAALISATRGVVARIDGQVWGHCD